MVKKIFYPKINLKNKRNPKPVDIYIYKLFYISLIIMNVFFSFYGLEFFDHPNTNVILREVIIFYRTKFNKFLTISQFLQNKFFYYFSKIYFDTKCVCKTFFLLFLFKHEPYKEDLLHKQVGIQYAVSVG